MLKHAETLQLNEITSDLRETAFHEAGHFVIHYALFGPDRCRGRLTIVPGDGTAGSSQAESWWSEEDARNDVLVSFAGLAAQKLANPNADPQGAGSDDRQAREALRFLEEEERECEYRTKADQLVMDHRAEITALAEELLERKIIQDPFESELIVDLARGDITEEDLARYRMVRNL